MEFIAKKPYLDCSRLTKLLDSYITEEKLNFHIHTAEDTASLGIALELKLALILDKKHTAVNFPIENILNWIHTSNFDEICAVLRYALMVQYNESQYLVLLHYIKTHLNINDDVIKILQLLQVALSLCNSENELKIFKQFVETNDFHLTISNLLFVDSKLVINFICVYILPEYFIRNIHGSKHILEVIWQNALESKTLDILCAIPEYFVIDVTNTTSYFLLNHDAFWFLLQECLGSTSSVVQKQALYLLKRAIHTIELKENLINESQVVFWNLEYREAWQNFFMLLEISREKQLHLIEPSYQLLPTVKILHSSWLICIYKVLLTHPHSAVTAHAVRDVIQSDWYDDVDVYKMVISCILPALNKTEYIDQKEIWSEFSRFSNSLSDEKFSILLQQSAGIVWRPSICYRFYRSIFTHDRHLFISFNLIEDIVSSIEKLPHKFIRSACMDVARNFIVQAMCTKLNFNDYVIVDSIIFSDQSCNQLIDCQLHVSDIQKAVIAWSDSTSRIELKEVKVILKLIEGFDSVWCKQYLMEPFLKRKFSFEILDRLCLFLCLRGMICGDQLTRYVQDRLVDLKHTDEAIIPLLISGTIDFEFDLENLLNYCIQILISKESKEFQVEVAFEIVTIALKNAKFNSIKLSDGLDTVLSIWKENFKDSRKFNKSLCSSFLHLYCNKLFCDKHITSKQLIEVIAFFEQIIQTQDSAVIPQMFVYIKCLLDQCEDLEPVLSFLDLCIKQLIERKRTDVFKIAVENFIQSIFTNSRMHDKKFLEKLRNITLALLELAHSSDDVAYSLAKHLCGLLNLNAIAVVWFMPIIVELLLFGDVLKKDQRAEYIICQEIDIDKQGFIDENNPNFRRLSVRGHAVNIVQNILNSDAVACEDRSERADQLAMLLMDKYRVHFNKRYFAHSYVHLQKLRILQALLVVHDYVKSQKRPLIDLLMDSLCTESHQVSVKFLIQWLLIRLLSDNEECLPVIRSKMDSTSKVHSSTIIAFVPILYHIALWRSDEAFWICLFEMMLPWTMGAHFNLRLYAQEGIKKLYEVACERNFVHVRSKFKSSADSITDVLQKTERKIDLIDKYVFDAFNAKDHHHLHTIYFTIPKITNVIYDEYENISNIIECKTNTIDELCNKYWSSSSEQEQIKSPQHLQTNVIQKKITPCTSERIQRQHNALVVVASLIDKAPNLGGLSRTCEVFGVKQLVVNSMNVVKDHEFQSVGMSSENWVDIVETKVDNLRSFLLSMKEQGYSIVGAEQTSDSIRLNVFKFPKKCLLLLGNEKEGISPNLLSLIDFCVEIPQFGVVRSLNVHVAASTFIWEYTKQHLMQ